jgi:hypothetical protein
VSPQELAGSSIEVRLDETFRIARSDGLAVISERVDADLDFALAVLGLCLGKTTDAICGSE